MRAYTYATWPHAHCVVQRWNGGRHEVAAQVHVRPIRHTTAERSIVANKRPRSGLACATIGAPMGHVKKEALAGHARAPTHVKQEPALAPAPPCAPPPASALAPPTAPNAKREPKLQRVSPAQHPPHPSPPLPPPTRDASARNQSLFALRRCLKRKVSSISKAEPHVVQSPSPSALNVQAASKQEQHVLHAPSPSPNHNNNNTTTKEEQQLAPTLSPPDRIIPRPPSLPSPTAKRRRVQTPRSQPVKTEHTVSDDVVIVSEKLSETRPKRATKKTNKSKKSKKSKKSEPRLHAAPTHGPPCTTVNTELTPQTEYEKEQLIKQYALHVVERDPDTDQVQWVVCKFCPIFGCRKRNRAYIMAYRAPLCRTALERHLLQEHGKHWHMFNNGSQEVKRAMFHRKRMPLDHVLHRRIAELKNSWGMQSNITDAQRDAWSRSGEIAKQWKRNSNARMKVPVAQLAKNLGVELNAKEQHTDKQPGASHKQGKSSGGQWGEGQSVTLEERKERKKQLKKEAKDLDIQMNDRGSEYDNMSHAALKAAFDRKIRYERRNNMG